MKKDQSNQEKEQNQSKEETCIDEIAELTSVLQHVQADFENYKKRVEKERELMTDYIKKDFMLKILPSLDMFELSLKHKSDHEQFVQGIEMIRGQLQNVLLQEGFSEIKETTFDPHLHEAVETVEGKDGEVVEIVQKGYKLKDQVVRCARVKVGKEKSKESKHE